MTSLRGQDAALLTVVVLTTPTAALACSSCGCTLSSDWSSQGLPPSGEGFRVDLRFDYFDQNQLRSGTGTVDRASLAIPNDQEIQQKTIKRNWTLGFDYSPNPDWGVNLQLPWFDRYHTTIAPGDTEISMSHTQSIGDARLVGCCPNIRRYPGGASDDLRPNLQNPANPVPAMDPLRPPRIKGGGG
jgi:hypothetical protein